MNDKKREKLEEQLAKKAHAIEEYASKVIVRNETEVMIDDDLYELVENYHDGFQIEKIKERFSPVLTKFDYIVGDMGYDQLRLRGFYKNSRKVSATKKIDQLQDYLYEYCNFGCPYFILKNLNVHESFPVIQKRKTNKKYNRNTEKKNQPKKDNNKTTIKVVKSKNKRQGSRHFVIRKKKRKQRK
nr:YutD family protein [uncultured Ligilactobacillus sp.]